ncbi:hypothetical protein FC48_GL001702 [Ligilactobacillus murinus DSM 20452 = NBRC 14221]|uniref:Uncharacterized protein n=1 Tax=Ligilactobacillus murinus DSM 20452 = NBRC 14221 TaxID=1423772 RepID=A0A0R2B4K3_9LACO|nr:hypothetical protein FC48_GL001702 [Ligilactobacillus murinus DSM 20452 = NBRC 14221]
MKKSTLLSNAFTLFKFYLNDTLSGLLHHPILRNKLTRIILVFGGVIFYLWYFYINMRSFSNLGDVNIFPKLATLTKVTIISYINMFLILGLYISTFINTTLNFNNTNLFITNLLPFSKKEITLGQKLFKLSVSLVLFELCLIIVFPFFTRIAIISLLDLILLLLIFHHCFILSFLAVDAIYSFVLKFISIKATKLSSIVTFIFDIFIIAIATLYMLVYRFPVENIIGHSSVSISFIILTTYILTFLIILTIITIILKFNLYTPIYFKRKIFLSSISLSKLGLLYTLPAIFRQKNFIYSLTTIAIMSIITWVQSGIHASLYIFCNFYFLINITGINYASSTIKFRKFYSFYRISTINEFISLILSAVVLSIPQLIVLTYLRDTQNSILITYSFFAIALIFGFLFPKFNGILNEIFSVSLSMILIFVIYQLLTSNSVFISIVIILFAILFIILQKERVEIE